MKRISFISIIAIAFYSCSNQPTCDGGDVEEVLFGIIKDEMKKELKRDYYNENYNYSDVHQYARDNGLDFNETNEQVKKDIESKASAYALAETIKATFELNGARLLQVNEKLKKCECVAELIINDENTLDIGYTAQYTEDGQVYVEVSY